VWVLCQHPLGSLAACFRPLVLLSAAGNQRSGCQWVSVPAPVVSWEGAALLWVVSCRRGAGHWCHCTDSGAFAMLPASKCDAPCRVWFIS
uniref:Uncharacterized protein n=1 Tax=Athene cunicularia TaxID=194338 RepID=A0A663MTK5_ATHCN